MQHWMGLIDAYVLFDCFFSCFHSAIGKLIDEKICEWSNKYEEIKSAFIKLHPKKNTKPAFRDGLKRAELGGGTYRID